AYGVFLQSRRAGDYLEYRTGVVKRGYRLVCPLQVPRERALSSVLLLSGRRIKSGEHLSRLLVVNIGRVVEIVVWLRRHGVYRAGVAVHDYRAGLVVRVICQNRVFKRLFGVILDSLVYIGVKRRAVDGVIALLVLILKFRAVGVYRSDYLAVSSGEILVVVCLKPVNSVAVIVKMTYYVCRKVVLGIISLRGGS